AVRNHVPEQRLPAAPGGIGEGRALRGGEHQRPALSTAGRDAGTLPGPASHPDARPGRAGRRSAAVRRLFPGCDRSRRRTGAGFRPRRAAADDREPELRLLEPGGPRRGSAVPALDEAGLSRDSCGLADGRRAGLLVLAAVVRRRFQTSTSTSSPLSCTL